MNQVLLYNVNRQSVIQLIAHKIQIIHLLHEHVPTKCWLVHIGLQEWKKKKKAYDGVEIHKLWTNQQ